MILTIIVVIIGSCVVCGVIIWMRSLDADRWRQTLVAYQMHLPANLAVDDAARWLRMVAASTTGPRWSLLLRPPLGLELVATKRGIEHYLLVPRSTEAQLLSTVRAGLPGVRLTAAPHLLTSTPRMRVAGELTMTSRLRPLAVDRAEATSVALLSTLQPVGDEEIRLQWAMTSAGTPEPVRSASLPTNDRSWRTYLLERELPTDADAVRAARAKQQDGLLLQVVMRIGVAAPSNGQAYRLFGAVWSNGVHGLNAPGVRLVRRWLPSSVVARRMEKRTLPVTGYPLLLSARELTGLIGFPLGGHAVPGLSLRAARQLAPSPGIPAFGTVLADSNSPSSTRPIALQRKDQLRHTYLLSPTGGGKSTLIANMALQNIYDGAGIAVIDPKSDLIDDILARMPAHRRDDVIVLDPAATDRPVGLNLLGGLHSEADRELAVDHVVHIMASLWKDSWGPRSNDIVRSALLTLVHATAPDGSPLTLVEVPELLTNPSFRRFVTGQKTIPDVVRPFWYAYEQMSEGERANVIAAPMNKLRTLTTRSAARLMLGQGNGVDVGDVFRKRRILLVRLSKGVLGAETAQLLGSLVTTSLFQRAFGRAAIPPEHRRASFVYLDEFQEFLRLPLDIADALAQLRSLGVGLTLAHQYLSQLPEVIRSAVLGTARTSVVYQLDYDDARVMERRFAPLTAADLMNLPAYEVAMRLSVDGQTQPPVTGLTRPLPAAMADAQELAGSSRTRYGLPRADVDAALKARATPPGSPGTEGVFGRKVRSSGS
jgi:hypothetical protein